MMAREILPVISERVRLKLVLLMLFVEIIWRSYGITKDSMSLT